MRDLVAEKGHVSIWVGDRKGEGSAWEWVNGEVVDPAFWREASDAQGGSDQSVIVRWVGSFQASPSVSTRVAGYLCRWD